MKLLALETSTETLSIALGHASAGAAPYVVAAYSGAGAAQSSATLLPAVQRLLAEAGWSLRDLTAIAFGQGPGSFTGLRTACSVAQGLALGADLPVVPVDTLMAVAEEAYSQLRLPAASADAPGLRVIAAMDARMNEIYTATYERLPVPSSAASSAAPAALAWRGGAAGLAAPQDLPLPADALAGAPVWLAGNARLAYGDRLPAPALALPHVDCLPTAQALLQLAPGLLAAGGAVDPALALPRYVRDKVAQTTAERMAARAANAPT